MQRARIFHFVFLLLSLVVALPPALAQVVTATIPGGTNTFAAAVNSATNNAYVADFNCAAQPCPGPGTVTVINGATNSTATVTVGVYPYALAVNAATNKIYVADVCGDDLNCNSLGTVTVIDGVTNDTTKVTVGYYPYSLAVNPATNKIYVANACGNTPNCNSAGTVTVIDANNNNSTSTVNVGVDPVAVAVNATTNYIYVANATCFQFPSCPSAGTVTVINGTNNNPQTVNVGVDPLFLAVNSVTNKIYVSNDCGSDITCSSLGTVTVIDGATNTTTQVNVGSYPLGIAVNSATNQIYVANNCGKTSCNNTPGTATVINANNNYSTTTVYVGFHPVYLDIDTVANKIYMANTCGNDPHCKSPGTVTVIDGATNSTLPVAVGDEPDGLAVNSSTHRIYVPNFLDNTVSIIGGNTTLQFVAVTPCRLLDTRNGSPIQGGTFQTFNLTQLAQQMGCANLSTAAAYSLNPAVVPQGPLGYLTIWPASQFQPLVATMNSLDGRVKANAAIVQAGVSTSISVFASNTTDLVLDIDGYFTAASQSTLTFYTLTPCRVADTRDPSQPQGLGPPFMPGGQARDFPILKSNCKIPNGAAAYSFNMTAVPHVPLGYMTVWPAGKSQPLVSTLNAPTGTVTANAAIVPAGTGGGDIDVYPSNDIDLVIDVNGYFAAPGGQNPLSLYPTAPCRVLDTRNGNGAFVGELAVNVVGSVCAPPSTAQGYVFNATVVPSGPLGYLTLWPDGTKQPLVATLNAIDGAVTSNMAIVPTNNGSIDAYASNLTQLILDISSYFAP